MRVKCVRTKVSEFLFKSEHHREYFRRRLGASQVETGFDDLIVGKVYVVYAVTSLEGYPLYFVKTSEQPFFDYHLQPGPCFDMVDNALSKLWVYKYEVRPGTRGGEFFHSTLAIREWVEEDDFLHRLIDGKPRELEIWTEAARKIELEALSRTAST